MTPSPRMTETELLRQLLARPGLYVGEANADTLLAFFSGYSMACWMRGVEPPFWDEILSQARRAIALDMADGSLSLDVILQRVSGGDRELALEILSREIARLAPRTDGA